MTTDPSGFIHLFPVLPVACLLYLGWRQPGIVGVGLLLLGLIMLALRLLGSFELNALLSGLLIVQGPFFISGLCLLLADRLARRFSDHPQASSDDVR